MGFRLTIPIKQANEIAGLLSRPTSALLSAAALPALAPEARPLFIDRFPCPELPDDRPPPLLPPPPPPDASPAALRPAVPDSCDDWTAVEHSSGRRRSKTLRCIISIDSSVICASSSANPLLALGLDTKEKAGVAVDGIYIGKSTM